MLEVGPSGAREIVLALGPPGGHVEGRVFDPEGAPFSGARVKIGEPASRWQNTSDGARNRDAGAVAVVTDELGHFESPGDVQPGLQPVSVMARGFPIWKGSVEVRTGESSSIEARLTASARIEGVVLDDQGVVVEGAEVSIRRPWQGNLEGDETFPSASAISDDQGRFLLDWVPEGEQLLHARVPERTELGQAQARVLCTAGRTSTVELTLDQGARIVGRVVDLEQRPIGGWRVEAFTLPPGVRGIERSQTDDEGGFVIPNLDPTLTYSVGTGPIEEFGLMYRAQAAEVHPNEGELRLVAARSASPGGGFSGWLFDAEGRPPGEIVIYFLAEGQRFGMGVNYDAERGRFERDGLPPGTYYINILHEDMVMPVFASDAIVVRSGRTTDLGTISFANLGSVQVAIDDLQGGARDSLRVEIDRPFMESDWPGWTLELRDLGDVFQREREQAGTWMLRVRSDSLFVPDRPIEVTPGEKFTLRVEAVEALSVPVVCSFSDSPETFEMFSYEIRGPHGELVRQREHLPNPSLDKGFLHLQGLVLPRGEWVIEANTDSGLFGLRTILVGEAAVDEPWVVDLR
jgi:hypothetical protein